MQSNDGSKVTKGTYTSGTTISITSNINRLLMLIKLREGDTQIRLGRPYTSTATAYILDEGGNIVSVLTPQSGYSVTLDVTSAVYVFYLFTSGTNSTANITIS